jgi:hypothetical protein
MLCAGVFHRIRQRFLNDAKARNLLCRRKPAKIRIDIHAYVGADACPNAVDVCGHRGGESKLV